MFESCTYENLLRDVLENAPEDIDTRPGSIFYDAVSGILIKVAKLYTDLELIFSLTQIDTAAGEYLDVKASEYGIARHSAVKAKYHAVFEGTVPETGERFFSGGKYFSVVSEDNALYFKAEEPGTEYNGIYAGTQAVPVDTIEGLTLAQFGELSEYGADSEDDESLRRRVREKISGAGENGNKSHYKIWCESVEGVGKARIFPLWNGPDTVKGVLISYDGLPCTADVVESVQEYIDPGSTGLGEGVANLGAHFTAQAAESTAIDISVTVEIDAGASAELVKSDLENAVKGYFKEQVMNSAEEETVIRYSGIGAVISGTAGVIDYNSLLLNGSTGNIAVDEMSVPVPGVMNIEIVQ